MENDNENKKVDGWQYVKNSNSNNNEIGKVIILMVISVVVLVGAVVGGMKGYDYLEKNKIVAGEKDTEQVNGTEGNLTSENDESIVEPTVSIEEIYNYVHHMANTIIIPIDGKIIGEEEITKDSIQKALAGVEGQDDYLYNELKAWENGNFNNSIDVHNYVWRKLGGNIGRAKSLDDEEIENVKSNLE